MAAMQAQAFAAGEAAPAKKQPAPAEAAPAPKQPAAGEVAPATEQPAAGEVAPATQQPSAAEAATKSPTAIEAAPATEQPAAAEATLATKEPAAVKADGRAATAAASDIAAAADVAAFDSMHSTDTALKSQAAAAADIAMSALSAEEKAPVACHQLLQEDVESSLSAAAGKPMRQCDRTPEQEVLQNQKYKVADEIASHVTAAEHIAEQAEEEGKGSRHGRAEKQSQTHCQAEHSPRASASKHTQQASDYDALLQQQLDRIRQSAVMLSEPAEVLVTDLIDHRYSRAVLCCAVLCCAVLCNMLCCAVLWNMLAILALACPGLSCPCPTTIYCATARTSIAALITCHTFATRSN